MMSEVLWTIAIVYLLSKGTKQEMQELPTRDPTMQILQEHILLQSVHQDDGPMFELGVHNALQTGKTP